MNSPKLTDNLHDELQYWEEKALDDYLGDLYDEPDDFDDYLCDMLYDL